MMSVWYILGYALLTAVLAIAFFSCFRKSRRLWRTAVLADLPYCAGCKPNGAERKSERADAERAMMCTSCRQSLGSSDEIYYARAPRRPTAGFIYSLATFVLIAGNIGFSLWWYQQVIWHRFMPLSMLLYERRTGVPFGSHDAIQELARRVLDDNRGLPPDVLNTLVNKGLSRQADLNQKWDPWAGGIVDVAWYKGLLSKEQVQKWVDNMLAPSNKTEVSVRQGALGHQTLKLTLHFGYRGSGFLHPDIKSTIDHVTLNGLPVAMDEYQNYGPAGWDYLDFDVFFEKDTKEVGPFQAKNHLTYVCHFEDTIPDKGSIGKHTVTHAYQLDFNWAVGTGIQVVPGSLKELSAKSGDKH